jgi:hypothetical protein
MAVSANTGELCRRESRRQHHNVAAPPPDRSEPSDLDPTIQIGSDPSQQLPYQSTMASLQKSSSAIWKSTHGPRSSKIIT